MQKGSGPVLLLSALALLSARLAAAEPEWCINATRTDHGGHDACTFETECGDNAYLQAYKCASDAGKPFIAILGLGWLGLLFVLLGSTADDYFSPALEQFSNELGLPPRFAGVTLLALGNGAPDVSATINAIRQGGDSYKLSLGALSGAGMFVGTVVAGCVMVISDGVKARGALIRDVTMYCVTCIIVLAIFLKGEVTRSDVGLLLGLYFSFITVVLAADVYHRTVVLPRLRAEALNNNEPGYGADAEPEGSTALALLELLRTDLGSKEFYSVDSGSQDVWTEGGVELLSKDERSRNTGTDGNIESPDVLVPLPPASPPPSRAGRQNRHRPPPPPKHRANAGAVGCVPEGGEHMTRREQYVIMHADEAAGEDSAFTNGYVTLSPDERRPAAANGAATDAPVEPEELDILDRMAEEWQDYKEEFFDLGLLGRLVFVLESPFTLLRKMTVPLTAEDAYSRPWLVVSIGCVPLWSAFYFWHQGTDLYTVFVGSCPLMVLLHMLFTGLAAAVAKFTKDSTPPPLAPATALALLGFVLAAMWIDLVADQLVSMLTFYGDLLKIPDSVLGLTVLAWGNSIGDLSTDMAMAKKGLANMAITACFAGPVFNMLVGLGGGFGLLLQARGVDSVKVELEPGLLAGMIFLIINCVGIVTFGLLHQNHVPKQYGYVSLVLYAVYILVSFLLLLNLA